MSERTEDRPVPRPLIVLAWAWVVIPFGYGLWQLVLKIPGLFGS
ncbi:hypothetical protein JOF28_001541 [Leucobacter exalbidus]|uniref:Uncharacterized protein n=1 Tax=Leucobacter exalbidus TaxID=662960 RepID=A0A940T3Z8_9MICO|nr:hypothetical protein [Leucobacter exalbidus]MBP1326309.1 hypothetical protein [Leucobacter exalbidus]